MDTDVFPLSSFLFHFEIQLGLKLPQSGNKDTLQILFSVYLTLSLQKGPYGSKQTLLGHLLILRLVDKNSFSKLLGRPSTS